MKNIIIILALVFSTLSLYAQDFDKETNTEITTYETYDQLVNDNGIHVGRFYNSFGSFFGSYKLIVIKDGKEKEVVLKKLWGFKVGDKLFRMKKTSPNMPIMVYKVKDKVFYYNGYLFLNYIKGYGAYTNNDSKNVVFYSDNLNSKVYSIYKLPNKEKGNELFSELIECVKKAKERYGDQAEVNSLFKCIEKY